MVLHYITQKFNLLPNSDISEITIVTNYLGYIVLYFAVIRLAKKGVIKGVWNGYIVPVLGMAGAIIILFGGFQNPLFALYMLICGILVAAALIYARVNKAKIK